jgi:hypothetical protein
VLTILLEFLPVEQEANHFHGSSNSGDNPSLITNAQCAQTRTGKATGSGHSARNGCAESRSCVNVSALYYSLLGAAQQVAFKCLISLEFRRKTNIHNSIIDALCVYECIFSQQVCAHKVFKSFLTSFQLSLGYQTANNRFVLSFTIECEKSKLAFWLALIGTPAGPQYVTTEQGSAWFESK